MLLVFCNICQKSKCTSFIPQNNNFKTSGNNELVKKERKNPTCSMKRGRLDLTLKTLLEITNMITVGFGCFGCNGRVMPYAEYTKRIENCNFTGGSWNDSLPTSLKKTLDNTL